VENLALSGVSVRFMSLKILFRVILEQTSAKHFSDTQSVVGRKRAKNLETFFRRLCLFQKSNSHTASQWRF